MSTVEILGEKLDAEKLLDDITFKIFGDTNGMVTDEMRKTCLDIFRKGVASYPDEAGIALGFLTMHLTEYLAKAGHGQLRVYRYKIDDKYQGLELSWLTKIAGHAVTIIIDRYEARWGQLLYGDEDLTVVLEWLHDAVNKYLEIRSRITH